MSSFDKNCSSFAIINCVWTSNKEPIAISKNRLNSISLFLLQPSAIFEGIETAALVNWLLKPNFSSDGNLSDNGYICLTSSIPIFQI